MTGDIQRTALCLRTPHHSYPVHPITQRPPVRPRR